MGEGDVDPVYANRPIQVGRSVFKVCQQRNPESTKRKEKGTSVCPNTRQTRGGGPQAIKARESGNPNSHAFERVQFSSGDLIEAIILERTDERVLGDAFM